MTRQIIRIAIVSALSAQAQTGLYTLTSGTATQSNSTYAATLADQSAVYVTSGANLTLISPTITKTGNGSSTTTSSQYGVNAGILAASAGVVVISGGSVTTGASGSNGLFATGAGSAISMSNGLIATTGAASHGVDVTYGGSITLNNVNITTALGSACAALSTDYGGGTVTVTGGTMQTAGSGAPGIYSTGVITVTGATITATGEGGGVIDGANTIALTNTSLTGLNFGIKLHQTAPASGSATVTLNGGSLTATKGDAFYLAPETGTLHASITVKGGTAISASTGNLVNATVASVVTLTLDGETIAGNLIADTASSIAATLQNSAALKGSISKSALTMDGGSAWIVTANSTLTSFIDSSGISGTSITNVMGNGYTVTYDATLSTNNYLGGLTYTLENGGSLTPASSVTTAAPAITSISNAASGIAGVAPGAWISIFGTNLAPTTALVAAANLVSGYLPTTFNSISVTIDGKSAYLDYVSPTQLNVQAPADSTTGSVIVKVTTSAGTASASATMQPLLPGLFTSSNYVLAVRPSDGAILNGASSSANPGDVLAVYATGLGATTPSVAPGLVFSGTYAVTASAPTVTIGGTTAAVSFAGLVGAGLYQINLTVPTSLAAGSYPVVVTQSAVSSPSTAVLKITVN
jgi:uncharacterized protein (TIGR03437 family)